MTVSIATIFEEEIEKKFRNHLPKECVELLIVMANQNMETEAAVNEVRMLMNKFMQYVVLNDEVRKQMTKRLDAFDKRFGASNIMTEKVREQ